MRKLNDYIRDNKELLKEMTESEITALLSKKFGSGEYLEALELIAYQEYQEANAFTLAEIGL